MAKEKNVSSENFLFSNVSKFSFLKHDIYNHVR